MWQVAVHLVYVVGGCLAGIIFAVLLLNLLFRFVLKNPLTLSTLLRLLFFRRVNMVPMSELIPAFDGKPELSAKMENEHALQPATSAINTEKMASVDNNLAKAVRKLLNEFEENYKISREFTGEELKPLKTDVWDASQNVLLALPGKLHEELGSIYAAIRTLNQLVWFSTEFQRRSPNLHEQYVKLLIYIAENIEKMSGAPMLAAYQKNS